MAAGAVATALILIAMGRMEWLRSAWLADAWRQERRLVLWMALLQTAAGLFQGVRYHAMLRATRVGTRMDESVGATCVSTGLSIWLPASPAVAELLRLGLLCRRGSPERLVRLGRATLASLMDRLLGLFTVFLLGSAFCGMALWRGHVPPGAVNVIRVWGVGALLAAGGVAVVARACMRGAAAAPQAVPQAAPQAVPPPRRRARCLPRKLGAALAALRAQAIRPRELLLPAALAAACYLLSGLVMALSIRAIGGAAPFAGVMAVLPAVFLSSALPASVGGLGAPQLAGILALGILGAEPAVRPQ